MVSDNPVRNWLQWLKQCLLLTLVVSIILVFPISTSKRRRVRTIYNWYLAVRLVLASALPDLGWPSMTTPPIPSTMVYGTGFAGLKPYSQTWRCLKVFLARSSQEPAKHFGVLSLMTISLAMALISSRTTTSS